MTRHPVPFLRASLLLLASAAAAGLAPADANAQAGACVAWPTGSDKSQAALQRTVKANRCVEVKPGEYGLKKGGILLPSGHTLAGQSAQGTTLRALPGAWDGGSGMIRVDPKNPARATLTRLKLAAGGRALLGISGGQVAISEVVIEGARCNGLSAFGRGISVDRSTFLGNGYGTTCPDAPPGAGIYAHRVPGNPIGPMRVSDSTFRGNGPALDVDQGVDGGTFRRNAVSSGGGWAGVSIFGSSGWTVDANEVRNPSVATGGVGRGFQFSYNTPCNGGPSGAQPAAIILCQANASGGRVTQRNRVTNNRASSFYGILLIGGDEAEAGNVPRFTTLSGNKVAGSRYGCADDLKPNQAPGQNAWSGNDCTPGYF